MRQLLLGIIVLCFTISLFGQSSRKEISGMVIYQTSQNIYAKFTSTVGIKEGDTICLKKDGILFPVFVVEYLSSGSCSGKPVGSTKVTVNDEIVAAIPEIIKNQKKSDSEKIDQNNVDKERSLGKNEKSKGEREQLINGRLSVLSYQNYSNTKAADFQRMRYTLSFNGKYLGDSRVSLESYITFSHRLDNWAAIKDNILNGLKVYDLALNYEFSKGTSIWFGRKINPKISSIGAIDGLQTEIAIKNFFVGAIVGFRPDYTNYGFNHNLLEYGAYLGHNYYTKQGSMHTSLAFFQQTNSGSTDRRYAYFQIDNSLVKNLNIFLSGEVDLYTLMNGLPASSLNLTSLYLSLSYRVNHKLSLYASYDARKNVIYYETDKSYLDQLLEESTRQGFQLRANYHSSKLLRFGLNGGYRYRKDDVKPSENATGIVTLTQIPKINTSATLSVNWINNSYINGFIYGLRLSKEIVPGKFTTDLNFRYVDNKLALFTTSLTQLIGGLDLEWNITRKLSFSVNYEGTFETTNHYHQVYLSLIQRF